MDLHKSSLMKSILEKVGKSLSSPGDELILTDLSDLMKKCHYLKIRSISNEYFTSGDSFMPDRVKGLLDAFRSHNNTATGHNNSFLKRAHKPPSLNSASNNVNDNISLSSDDFDETDDSEPVIKCRRRDSHQRYAIDESDSDIEIIDDRSAKENIDISKPSSVAPPPPPQPSQRYELRDRRKSDPKAPITVSPSVPRQSQPRLFRQTRNSAATTAPAEIIQIEDSSDEDDELEDEDVQEIGASACGSHRGRQQQSYRPSQRGYQRPPPPPQQQQQPHPPSGTARNRTDQPPTQADPSQLASIPLVVQFPTMQAATFNGHLYISHSHKFSVKLQGVDPRNFRWN